MVPEFLQASAANVLAHVMALRRGQPVQYFYECRNAALIIGSSSFTGMSTLTRRIR